MNNPKLLQTIVPAATYKVPTYKVTDNGIEDCDGLILHLSKGNKDDASALRQEGLFTETLIQLAKQYLESVNSGELFTNDTTQAIIKLEESLIWINKRSEDRKLRNVQATYNK